MRIVKLTKETTKNILENMLKRSPSQYGEYESRVQAIIQNIKENGDEALFSYTKQFDKADINASNVKVTDEEFKEAYKAVDPVLLDVIRKALVNIESYHELLVQEHPTGNDAWTESNTTGKGRRLCTGRKSSISVVCSDEHYAGKSSRCR